LKVYEILVDKKAHNIRILKRENNSFLVDVNGKTVEVKFANSGDEKFSLEIDGEKVQAELLKLPGSIMRVKVGGKTFEVQYPTLTFKLETQKIDIPSTLIKKSTVSHAVGRGVVLAPIAGRIVALKVGVGHKVSKGECICILEAMKMANEIAAPKDGVVKEIFVSEGAVVNKGDVLAVIV
jgi:biotin carboxyl carrier protein